jgi:hypothetical protein
MRGSSRSDWSSADKGKECTRGARQITVFTIEHVNRNGRLQTWNIDRTQGPEPQLLLDAAFRKECNPDARLDQSLLGVQVH